MTDLEFATCDLERLNAIYKGRRKFYELVPGDHIYCVIVNITPGLGLRRRTEQFDKYELDFFGMELVRPDRPKSRQARIFLSGDGKGIYADKNVSSFVRYKRIYRGDISLQVYGTSLEECIFKAEKTAKLSRITDKLVWRQPLL